MSRQSWMAVRFLRRAIGPAEQSSAAAATIRHARRSAPHAAASLQLGQQRHELLSIAYAPSGDGVKAIAGRVPLAGIRERGVISKYDIRETLCARGVLVEEGGMKRCCFAAGSAASVDGCVDVVSGIPSAARKPVAISRHVPQPLATGHQQIR